MAFADEPKRMLEFRPPFLKQVLTEVCCSSEEPWHLLVKDKFSHGRASPLPGFLCCSASDQFMATGPWISPSLGAFFVNEAFFDEGHQISGGSLASYPNLV